MAIAKSRWNGESVYLGFLPFIQYYEGWDWDPEVTDLRLGVGMGNMSR